MLVDPTATQDSWMDARFPVNSCIGLIAQASMEQRVACTFGDMKVKGFILSVECIVSGPQGL